MAPTKLHESYAQKMLAKHDYGWAFIEPPSNSLVCPGRCGYIDGNGNWNPIVDLCGDSNEFTRLGLRPPTRLPDRALSEKGIEWGPKYSENVSGHKIDVKAGVNALTLGLPVGLAAVFQIDSATDDGAVLLTEPTIWKEGFYHSFEFEEWVKENSEAILKVRPEVKEWGLWVVKWTYSTRKCSINAWIKKDRGITVGFSTNLTPVGEVGPKGNWTQSSSDGGWSHFTANGDDRKVVFMGGLYYRWRRTRQIWGEPNRTVCRNLADLTLTQKHLTPGTPAKTPWVFRSGGRESASTVVESEGEQFEVTVEHVGRLDNVDQDVEEDEEGMF